MKQQVIISKQFKSDLAKAIAECEHDRIFILVDETTKRSLLGTNKGLLLPERSTGDNDWDNRQQQDTRNTDACMGIIAARGATRHSLLINLGGRYGDRILVALQPQPSNVESTLSMFLRLFLLWWMPVSAVKQASTLVD